MKPKSAPSQPCPSCLGRGEVYKKFAAYDRDYALVTCRTCGGTGKLAVKKGKAT